MDEGGFNRYWKCRAISDGASLSSSHYRKWSNGFVDEILKDVAENNSPQTFPIRPSPEWLLSISARSSSQHLAFNGNAWRGCHELWQSCSKTAIRLNNACWLMWFVLKLFMLSPSTGVHWYRWRVGGGGIFDSRTSGRKDLRNCCDNTVTWKSFSEVVNRTKKMWNCSVTLFLICLLEATTSNRIRGIWILPLPFHTKLSWLPSHWFCEKSGFTAFHSYELASFFILSWIWLPTCSGSILSVQVSVGGRLIRGENQRTGVSLPFCLQNVRLLPSVTASRCDPPCTLHLTQPHFSLI